jgi:hypothetical protein
MVSPIGRLADDRRANRDVHDRKRRAALTARFRIVQIPLRGVE